MKNILDIFIYAYAILFWMIFGLEYKINKLGQEKAIKDLKIYAIVGPILIFIIKLISNYIFNIN